MDERATGIVLRTYPLTETSLIVHWLTADLGRIATVAKGARRPRSPWRGKIDLFYEADFSFMRARRSSLHTLREVVLTRPHAFLREQLAYLQQAAYVAALIEQNTETDTPVPAMFRLLQQFLEYLPAQAPAEASILAFEIKILHELGQMPELTASPLTPGSQRLASRFQHENWPLLSRLKPSAPQLAELKQFLNGFLVYHLGRVPRGRAAALLNPAA
jgi:DNA repair protein RecO (recombination protein O)